MRGMYDRDGMIAYAGKPRASTRWRSSRYKAPSQGRTSLPTDTLKAREVELDHRTHKERIADILASSKWNSPEYRMGG
jgi:uncharacterized protein YfaQ (DUF2300 family)